MVCEPGPRKSSEVLLEKPIKKRSGPLLDRRRESRGKMEEEELSQKLGQYQGALRPERTHLSFMDGETEGQRDSDILEVMQRINL